MNYRKFLIIIISLHLIFFLYSIFWGNIYVGDYPEYLNQAKNFIEHGNFYAKDYADKFDINYLTRRPPVYAVFIILSRLIINSDYSVIFFQSILSIINILGVCKLLKNFNFKINIYFWVLLFVILYPSQLIYANTVMTEMLFQTFLFWSVYFCFKFLKSYSLKDLLLNNIFIGLAVLTKPVMLVFVFINLLFFIFVIFKKKIKITYIFPCLIPVLCVLSFSYYNYTQTNYFHYSSLQFNHLFDYNAVFIIHNIHGQEEGNKILKEYIIHFDTLKTLKEIADEKYKYSKEIISNNFGQYLSYQMKGFANFFLDPGRFDVFTYLKINPDDNKGLQNAFLYEGYGGVIKYYLNQPLPILIYLTLIMLINLFFIIALIFFMFEKNVEGRLRLYMVMAVIYIAVFSANYAALRYKLPLYPILVIASVFLIEKLKEISLKKKTS
ncbi:MAG TPA: glycosyltransferase family 39 protein [Ignavibacteria bacterium]|nr:glycosyltransferase family 39 protein [Ignavibacteria bacterium]